MRIRAKLLHMAESEIKSIIPHDIYSEIKQTDPHPVFRAYVIGHEGEATATWPGVGKIVKNWFSSAINKIAKKLQYGLKIFHNHAETNEHEGRTPIGELVGKTIKTIKDRVNAIAITYIYPQYRNLPLDVASIETTVDIDMNDSGVYGVNVEDVTGIALGNSAVDQPGFSGATLLSELQAMAKKRGIEHEIPDRLQLGYSVKNTDQQDKLKLVEEEA